MTEIPDSIMVRARAAAHSVPICDLGSTEGIRAIARAIMEAKAEEREACARLLEAQNVETVAWSDSYDEDEWGKIELFDHAIKETLRVAATAIRALKAAAHD